MMRKAIKIGFIGVFCAVIGLAFPIFNIFSKPFPFVVRPAAGASQPAAGAAAES